MDTGEHIYALLRGANDWARVTSGDPSIWSYDRSGALPVSEGDLGELADTDV